MKYIFLDTMVFLHYRMFTEIDFLGLFGNEQTTIVIPEIVSQEIDKHKNDNPRQRVRQRAGSVNKKILQVLGTGDKSEIRKNLWVMFLPRADVNFKLMGLDESSNDHRIIGNILMFCESIDKTVDSVVFVTHDMAAIFLAQKRGVAVKGLSDELKLQEELDDEGRKIQQLQQELIVLKSLQPNLGLCVLGNRTGTVHIRRGDLQQIKTPSCDSLETIQKKFPLVLPMKLNDNNGRANKWRTLPSHSYLFGQQDILAENKDIERYNKDVESYRRQYQVYLNKIENQKKSIYLKLEMFVENMGTQPADEVDIYLHFPDGFEMFVAEDFPPEIKRPVGPINPRSTSELHAVRFSTNMPNLDVLSHLRAGISLATKETFSLRKTNSYEFDNHVGVIKHGEHAVYGLPILYLWYGDVSEIKNFTMDYRLSANNVPHAVKGKVLFNFDLTV